MRVLLPSRRPIGGGMPTATEHKVRLHSWEHDGLVHTHALAAIRSTAKRMIWRAGRRGAKTVAASEVAVEGLLAAKRVLYAGPTADQVATFWWEVKRAFVEPIDAGVYVKNETEHTIERVGTKERIRAKTAWNADTLRGDYADLLILDEWQLMDEDAWELVGAPMLLDNDGNAVFIYTPPSLRSRSVSKARDPRHAAKMYQQALLDTTGRWAAFTWTSHDNPFISREGLAGITHDMTALAIRQEIMAEDVDEAPGALWTRELLERTRVTTHPDLSRVVIGVDPPGGATECGIVVAGSANGHRYVLADLSLKASPETWAEVVLDAYEDFHADRIVGEANYGGDMVQSTILGAAMSRGITVAYKPVQATRGKAVRAEPCVAGYERGEIHHVGDFPALEDELTMWTQERGWSPNRLDALVWALTELDKPAAALAGVDPVALGADRPRMQMWRRA